MTESILEVFHSCLTERLGKVYNHNTEYKLSLKKESELAEKLNRTFTKDEMKLVEQYQTALSATMSICELLAYQQGMKDLATILGIKNKKEV